MRFRRTALVGCLVAIFGLFSGCAKPVAEEKIRSIVCTEAAPRPGAVPLDLRRLKVEMPEGYHRIESPSAHGGAFFKSGKRNVALINGYWGPSSFQDEAGNYPKPACEFEVNGIPVSLYVMAGEEPGEPAGITHVAAILKYPAESESEMVIQVLASAKIRNGDTRHAADVRDLIRSIHKGRPDFGIRAPDN